MQSGFSETEHLRWFAGVPVGTNLLILKDFGAVLVLVWIGMTFFSVLIQFFFGEGINSEQVLSLISYSNRLVVLLCVAFAAVAFVFLRNRYVVLVRLDREGIFCESMRKGKDAFDESFHWKAFPILPPPTEMKGVAKQIPWQQVRSMKPLPLFRVILVKTEAGVSVRIYCPDEVLFDRAVFFIKETLKEVKQGKNLFSQQNHE